MEIMHSRMAWSAQHDGGERNVYAERGGCAHIAGGHGDDGAHTGGRDDANNGSGNVFVHIG